jgi:hypothetical protein
MGSNKDHMDNDIIMVVLSNLHTLLSVSSSSSGFAAEMFFRSVISLWMKLSYVQV